MALGLKDISSAMQQVREVQDKLEVLTIEMQKQTKLQEKQVQLLEQLISMQEEK